MKEYIISYTVKNIYPGLGGKDIITINILSKIIKANSTMEAAAIFEKENPGINWCAAYPYDLPF